MRLLSLSLALGATLAAQACSRTAIEYGDIPDTPDPQGLSAENFLDRYLDARCAAKMACGELPNADACTELSLYGNIDTTFNTAPGFAASIATGAIEWDLAGAADCLEAVQEQPCTVFGTVGHLEDLCRNSLQGLIEEGEPCIHDLACAGGLTCEKTGPCSGTCQPVPEDTCLRRHADCGTGACENGACVEQRPAGMEGEDCGLPMDCHAGLSCVSVERSGGKIPTCVLGPNEGDTCLLLDGCRDGSFCLPGPDTSNVCQKPLGLGDACEHWYDCGLPWLGGTCDDDARRCVLSPTLGQCAPTELGYHCDPKAAWCDTSGEQATCSPFSAGFESCSGEGTCLEPWFFICDSDADGVDKCLPPFEILKCDP